MIRKYVSKPKIIKAVQWDGKNIDEIHEIFGDTPHSFIRIHLASGDKVELCVLNASNQTIAFTLDYIIKFNDGDIRPCNLYDFHPQFMKFEGPSITCRARDEEDCFYFVKGTGCILRDGDVKRCPEYANRVKE